MFSVGLPRSAASTASDVSVSVKTVFFENEGTFGFKDASPLCQTEVRTWFGGDFVDDTSESVFQSVDRDGASVGLLVNDSLPNEINEI